MENPDRIRFKKQLALIAQFNLNKTGIRNPVHQLILTGISLILMMLSDIRSDQLDRQDGEGY